MTTEADLALISLLRENARASTADLARRSASPAQPSRAVLKNWKSVGVIEGYTVRIAPEFERDLVRAHVLVTALPKLAPKVETALRSMMAVTARSIP